MLSNALKFMREVRAEGDRVTWPGFKDTRSMTIMVFILVTLVALFLMLCDWIIRSGVTMLMGTN